MKNLHWTASLSALGGSPPAGGQWIAPLEQYGLIRVSGDDAAAFLQTQLTRDLRHLAPDQTCLAAWCNAKGRVLTVIRVIPVANGFLLRLPAELVERVTARLKMFVLRSRVSLEDVSERHAHAGMEGAEPARILSRCCDHLPAAMGRMARAEGTTIIRAPGEVPRFELIARPQQMQAIARALACAVDLAPPAAWQLSDIKAGIPEVWSKTYEQFIPQSLNLDLLDAVSLRKGCYPGQEIVARTYYLGKVKRRMYLGCMADTLASPGDKIYSRTAEQAVGQIVSAAQANDGAWLLAVSSVSPDQTPLYLDSPSGPLIGTQALPYGLTVAPAS